ncbi:uncharacterized protein KIAA1143 homolog [Chelonus insularis]|uniref:uncharacterized protein KIAA1143 homolog n=1 Tax=Chelonus insularis TaxID=460826 RepID=UPI00158E508F|nr:uncharacterized protein KIAA1143 homolog [Chelonus insularis]XP_034940270.1 uncharacterized protein KIAA1143 homolog [Chelonus insularis]XP_034940271.1 uncharacterized protein KIAA1143 homolog [Chelonus insularis]
MSRKKHNVSYTKPEEPKFLQEIKAQIGYKEGPTVETKREALSEGEEDDCQDRLEEKPVVVVLNDGDLTAEEVDAILKKKEDEEANTPADLSKRIIFNRKIKSSEISETDVSTIEEPRKKKIKKSKESKTKIVLSFNDDDDE